MPIKIKSPVSLKASRMNPAKAHDRIAEISAAALEGDDEKAHGLEGNLHVNVLDAIAKGTCWRPRLCAAIASSSKKIDFQRWDA